MFFSLISYFECSIKFCRKFIEIELIWLVNQFMKCAYEKKTLFIGHIFTFFNTNIEMIET